MSILLTKLTIFNRANLAMEVSCPEYIMNFGLMSEPLAVTEKYSRMVEMRGPERSRFISSVHVVTLKL